MWNVQIICFDVKKNLWSDGVKNNNEEIFSAAHFFHKLSFPWLSNRQIFCCLFTQSIRVGEMKYPLSIFNMINETFAVPYKLLR